MTYRQATELGGQVRRGEHGAHSVYYSTFSKTEADRVTGEAATKNIRFLRSYTVFNVDQIDGLPAYYYPVPAPPEPRIESRHRAAIDAFFGGLPATVRHGGDQAFYSPIGDYIQLPQRGAFRSDDHYASTLAAPGYVHYSGAPQRLNREFGKKFGEQRLCVRGAGRLHRPVSGVRRPQSARRAARQSRQLRRPLAENPEGRFERDHQGRGEGQQAVTWLHNAAVGGAAEVDQPEALAA